VKGIEVTLLERFEKYYIPEPNSGCWLWIGALKGRGYGVFYAPRADRNYKKSHTVSAHIASFKLFKGETNGLNVCHTCDLPCCVNPEHLFLGTHQDNVDDMIVKGRLVKNFGEAHGRHYLTTVQVLAIRVDLRATRFIAADYQINPATVRKIKRRALWPHV
jgi:hypothetical protein